VANAIAALKQQGLVRSTLKQGVYICKGASPKPTARKRTGRIGVFAHGSNDILRERIYFDAFNGIRRAASAHGYNVMYLGSEMSGDAGDGGESMPLGVRDIDGLIYVVSHLVSEKFVREIRRRKIAIVIFDSRDEEQKVDSVLVDNVEGTKQVMRHLIGLGHRRIAFLNSSGGQSAGERLQGYRESLNDAGLAFDPNLVKRSAANVTSGRVAMRELLPLKPTAVFAFSDFLGMGAILAAEDAGLTVPNDLSVASFGNEALAYYEVTGRTLTTVDANMGTMGIEAVALLLQRLAAGKAPPQVVRGPIKLIIGNTTSKPKSSESV
jgi:LacI family transcriptional regulator